MKIRPNFIYNSNIKDNINYIKLRNFLFDIDYEKTAVAELSKRIGMCYVMILWFSLQYLVNYV